MALKTFNVQGGLSIGSVGDIFDANANLNLTNNIGNVSLGNVGNLHIAGGNANGAVLGSVTLNGSGNVTAIAITSRGDGYTIPPVITISGANTIEANATVTLFANGALNTISINNPGTGYSSGTVTATVSGPSFRYLKTDGAGTLSWFEVSSTGGGGGTGEPGGANTDIQFNDNGTLNGTDGFTFDKTSNAVTANGNVTASNFITSGSSGNITGANIVRANTFIANANVSIQSGTGFYVAVKGNTSSTGNYNFTLPVDVPGTSGQVLAGNTDGTTRWITLSANSITNGNSNVAVAANANVTISSNGQANIVTVSSDATNGLVGITGNLTVNNISNANVISANTLKTAANGAVVFVSNNGTSLQQVTLQSSTDANFDANYTLTLPVNDGNAGQSLTTDGSGILSWTTISSSGISNGNSNVNIPAANGNVNISAVGNANVLVVTGTGANITGTGNFSANLSAANLVTAGNVFAAAMVQNASTYDTRVSLSSAAGIIEINSNGNGTQFGPSGVITLAGASQIVGGSFGGSGVTLGGSQTDIFQNRGGNVTVQVGTGGTIANTWTFAQDGSLTVPGNINAGRLRNGNSNITITSNANVTITANSNAVVTITSSGDGNLQTTGGNVTGYWNVSGNAVAANFVGALANGNSNIRIDANGNIGISSTGQSNILFITSNGTFAQSTISNDLTVTGNLTVSGNAIYANTEILTIEDPIIELGTGANGAILISNDGKDRGVELHSYGNGAAYTTSGSTPSGNTTIVLVSTTGIVAGQIVTIASNPNAIPVGTTVSTVNAGNIVVDTPTTAVIAGASTLQIGNDILRFMGWSNANGQFQFYSSASITNEVVSGTLGNVNANTFIGAFQGDLTGNLVNGNSNIRIAANANVTISANGNANVFTVTSSGDGNLQTTGVNVAGYINSSANIIGANFIGIFANGNSNISIPSANGNVNISALGNANILVITGTGANITGTANVSGNANVGNLGTATAIITTGNITTVNTGLVQNGNSNIAITSNANITITANSNAVIAITSSGDGNVQTTGANITGYVNATGNATASNVVVKADGSLSFITGGSNVGSDTLTTTSATANQAIAKITAANGRGVEFIVKGIDASGAKYSATTVLAIVGNAANGDCDYTTFAQLNTGTTTGDISVALTDSNANITLQVTPASTNSTVWTTQYRVI